MGQRGPKETPNAIKINRGSRRINKHAPNETAGTPQCPHWLNGESKKIWRRLVPRLANMGVMTKIDGFPFARYCLYSVLWMKELSNPGRTEATLERYANQLNRLEQSFGLTPSARSSLSVSVGTKTKETSQANYKINFGERFEG